MGIRSLVFCANLLFFCEQNSDLLFSKSESLPLCSLKKSDGVKSDGSDSLLGLKVGKAVKNCQKHDENNEISIESLVFESQRAKVRFTLKKRANHTRYSLLKSDSLSSLNCNKRRERFAHGQRATRAIRSWLQI